jgi:hypothetical protein
MALGNRLFDTAEPVLKILDESATKAVIETFLQLQFQDPNVPGQTIPQDNKQQHNSGQRKPQPHRMAQPQSQPRSQQIAQPRSQQIAQPRSQQIAQPRSQQNAKPRLTVCCPLYNRAINTLPVTIVFADWARI